MRGTHRKRQTEREVSGRMRKAILAVAAAAVLLVPVAGVAAKSTGSRQSKVVVAVGWNYPALRAAKAQFKAAGLDVAFVPMRFSKGVVQAVANGSALLGIADAGVT